MPVDVGTRWWSRRSRDSARQRMCAGKRPIDDVVVDGVTYDAVVIAEGLAAAMEDQFPEWVFSYYQCLFCPHMHVGRLVRRDSERWGG